MIQRLREILRRVETWPEEVQDEVAASLLFIEQGYVGNYELTKEDRAALAQSAEDVRLGRFATDEQVREFFGRNRRS